MRRNYKPKACDHDEPHDSDPSEIHDEPDTRHVVIREGDTVKFKGQLAKAGRLGAWKGCRITLCTDKDDMDKELAR